jgi:uncharacterized protein YqhQ
MGKHDNLLSSILSAPGIALQNLTTNEPDDSMSKLHESLKLVIPEETVPTSGKHPAYAFREKYKGTQKC